MLVDNSLSDSVHEYNMAEDGQQPQMLVDKSLSDSMHEYNMGVSFQSCKLRQILILPSD